MKNQLLLLAALAATIFSCQSKESETPTTPLSEQNLEFEIYDSLVVDYLGNLYLADISEDGKTFLLIDQKTDTLFVTDSAGAILHKYTKKGDGPGFYQQGRSGLPRFLNSEEIIIPAFRGFYLYSLSGEATRTFLPDFNPSSSLIIPYSNKLISYGEKIYYPWEGRIADEFGVEGREFQTQVRKVEVLDLKSGQFSPEMPFPRESKFSSGEKSYLNISYSTALSRKDDSLFVAFRNEPVVYGYHFSNLDSPASIRKIPFQEFIEKEPKDLDKFGQYESKDIYGGTINSFHRTENDRFLVNYSRGLTEAEYQDIFDLIKKDQDAGYQKMTDVNTNGLVLFDGKSVSPIIQKPKGLGFVYEFISEEEIWFSPDYQEVEKDYVVIYKTRLVSK
ncbi:hypothetical protein [Algoriphagus marinus]|uniref:hypothetical protein n=1 Tax=Algoriphagus marinus TaxID=1925762 RepID=UPI00094B7EBD|nr:hypothetical protein [Algoriphagus marinus]